jgi:phosphate transport system substrate-binding protein
VKNDASSPAYVPSAETIAKGQYPITRFLYMYVRNKPAGLMKDYIDWILSPEGQKLVVDMGYFPVK